MSTLCGDHPFDVRTMSRIIDLDPVRNLVLVVLGIPVWNLCCFAILATLAILDRCIDKLGLVPAEAVVFLGVQGR